MPSSGILTPDQLSPNALTHQSAWNTDRWPDSISPLMGYPAGFPQALTYFHRENSDGDIRSQTVDISLGIEHAVHTNYMQINNLELRFDAEFQINHDLDNRDLECQCTFIVPVGFIPFYGDLFYYPLADGAIGLFIVDEIERPGLSAATYHKCTATLLKFMEPKDQIAIQSLVTSVWYFDKQVYFNGNMTLLSSSSWKVMNESRQLRQEIISYFGELYWDELMTTFMRPDGVYDPYLVAYWHRKVSMTEYQKRPTQLLPDFQFYNNSIWSSFTETNRAIAPKTKFGSALKQTKSYNFWNVGITPLINRAYLTLVKDTSTVDPLSLEDYVFSQAFYQEDTANMLTDERLVFDCLCGHINADIILAYVRNYFNWTSETAFYRLPIALWLNDMVYYSVK